jgi:hypothetical protein
MFQGFAAIDLLEYYCLAEFAGYPGLLIFKVDVAVRK